MNNLLPDTRQDEVMRGIIRKVVNNQRTILVPPRVEYELTPLGRGLTEPVLGLVSWLQSNWPTIRSARDRFDARKQMTRTVARPMP